jgi:hypothetical protein
MASRVVTVWECDRCEAKVEEKGGDLPKGWRSVSVQVRGAVEATEEHEAELCAVCAKNLIEAVEPKVKPAPAPQIHYPPGVR